jgi:hypothetical protein
MHFSPTPHVGRGIRLEEDIGTYLTWRRSVRRIEKILLALNQQHLGRVESRAAMLWQLSAPGLV